MRLLTELRIAFRTFRRQAPAAGCSVLLFALGLAFSTAVYSVVDALLLRPLPFKDPAHLVVTEAPFEIRRRLHQADLEQEAVRLRACPLVLDLAQAQSGPLDETGSTTPFPATHATVSPNFFTLLGVRPFLGRTFDTTDVDSSPLAAVIASSLWKSRFASGDVIGRVVTFGGRRIEIVGIMPPDFEFPYSATLWTPMRPLASSPLGYVRLAGNVTPRQFASQFPRLVVTPLREVVRPREALALLFLLLGSGLVLLLASVQVAALQSARLAARWVEVDTRISLGARRWDLARQFACDCSIVIAGGVVLGWILVPALSHWAVLSLPPEIVRGRTIHLDSRAFIFSACLAIAGLFAFIATSLYVASPRDDIAGRSVRERSTRIRRVGGALLVAQVSLTCLLAYLAGLAVQSLQRLDALDPGFEPTHLVVANVPQSVGPIASTKRRNAVDAGLQVLQGVHGVVGSASAFFHPFQHGALHAAARLPGTDLFEPVTVRVNYVSPGYFQVLKVPLSLGFGSDITTQFTPGRAVVNQSLARLIRTTRPVLGSRIRVMAEEATIVGIVNDFADEHIEQKPEPHIFFRDTEGASTSLILRVEAVDAETALKLRSALSRTWGVPDVEVRPIADYANAANAPYRGRARLLGWMALVGLLLGTTGVMGAFVFGVRHRRREIAVRLALGAPPHAVTWLLVQSSFKSVTAGLLLGLVGGSSSALLFRAIFFRVGAVDPSTMSVVAATLLIAATLSTVIVATLVSRFDPSVALRDE